MNRRRVYLLSPLGVSLLSGCSDIGTTLGRPTGLGSPRLINFGVYVGVLGLLGLAAVHLIQAARKPSANRMHLQHSALLFGVALLIRQWLPQTSSGLLLVPPIPFGHRVEWVTTFISGVAWLTAIIGLCIGMPPGRSDEQASAGAVLTIIGTLCTALLGFWNPGAMPSVNAPIVVQVQPAPAPETRPLSVDQARQYLTDWTRQRDNHAKTLAVFLGERDELVNHLRGLGTPSSEELLQKPEARVLADELVDITRQIESLSAESDRLSLAVVKMNSVLRRIERHQRLSASNSLSAAEHSLLEQSVRELESTLRPATGLPAVV